jgi:hypothetical protein
VYRAYFKEIGMDFSKLKLPKGIKMRDPYESELKYFMQNPNVAGMATEDNKVILNRYSNLSADEYQAVAINESARVLMRNPKYMPDFDLTTEQVRNLDTTDYRTASEQDRMATIAARILSGDPSGGTPTTAQMMFVKELREALGLED